MKKLIFTLTASLLLLSSCGDSKKEEHKKKGNETGHVCTDRCREAGHCVMSHGEDGHVCTDQCKNM